MQTMLDENISIDQLEDEIIDHPDQQTIKQINLSSLQETFQQKLNERANQILSGQDPQNPSSRNASFYQFLQPKVTLAYEYSDFDELRSELAQWFVSSDFSIFDWLNVLDNKSPLANVELNSNDIDSNGINSVDSDLDSVDFTSLSNGSVDSADLCNGSLHLDKLGISSESPDLNKLLKIILGDPSKDEKTHLSSISANCQKFMSHQLCKDTLELLNETLQKCIHTCMNAHIKPSFPKTFFSNYFKLLTIVYFTVTTAISTRNQTLLGFLRKVDLMTSIMKLLDVWKKVPDPRFRIRNCIHLFWKLILLEFGDSSLLQKADVYQSLFYKIKKAQSLNLSSTQLEYCVFNENLLDKYPLSNPKFRRATEKESFENPSELDRKYEQFMAFEKHARSISNFMEIPRTNKAHSILGLLPPQTLHLCTTTPMAPSTPSDFMTGGEKVRRMYHVHQGMPLLYPYEELQPVPVAIDEARKYLRKAVQDSYSAKLIERERELFLKQERGSTVSYAEIDLDNFDSDKLVIEGYDDVKKSLQRVEAFYRTSMCHFRGFIEVCMMIIKTSNPDFNYRDVEKELDPETSYMMRFGTDEQVRCKVRLAFLHTLEKTRAKEITLKATSAILSLLMKWFKVNHVLQEQYFGTLLFESQFFLVFLDFLSENMNNTALQNTEAENKGLAPYDVVCSQNKLMNPMIQIDQFDFFRWYSSELGSTVNGQIPIASKRIPLVNKRMINTIQADFNADGTCGHNIQIREFNGDFCFLLRNFFDLTDSVLINNVSRRVFVLNELKPTDLLKIFLLNYLNPCLEQPILHILKKLIPYQGRKWRAQNMDIVSLVYMNSTLSLSDDWLSGRDLESDFNTAFDQEHSLKGLFQFFHMRRYPDQMRCLGYTNH